MFKLCVLLLIFAVITFAAISAHSLHKRSVGGQPTTIEQYPYVASLRQNIPDYEYYCCGSIIDQSWILTAAHCAVDNSPDDIIVGVGSEILLSNKSLLQAVKNIYPHPKYHFTIQHQTNDIALIELEKPLNFSKTVQPIKLGKLENDKVTEVLGLGWGRYIPYLPVALGDKLRVLEQNTMKEDPCQKIHNLKDNIVDGKTQICAAAPENQKSGMCGGDSGGPLIDKKTKQQYAIFTGYETCTGEFPSLFARVEPYIDWINNVTKLNFTL